jgi:hypothetical protein
MDHHSRPQPHPTGDEFDGWEYRSFWLECFTNPFQGNLCWGVRVTPGLRYSGSAKTEAEAQFLAAQVVDEYLEELEAMRDAERARHEADYITYSGVTR